MILEKRELPKRKPNRLKDYDYSSEGAYFITICTKDRAMLFGHVEEHNVEPNKMILSDWGKITDHVICNISDHYPCITVDHYVIMPNHIHLLLSIDRSENTTQISSVIRHLKSYVSREIGQSVWQKSFHDHIVRNEKSYYELWNYININPDKWVDDCFHPNHSAGRGDH